MKILILILFVVILLILLLFFYLYEIGPFSHDPPSVIILPSTTTITFCFAFPTLKCSDVIVYNTYCAAYKYGMYMLHRV